MISAQVEQGQASSAKPPHIGQGRAASTILTSQGDVVHVVTDVPYTIRSRRRSSAYYKGSRAMHQSTLRIPAQSHTEYSTSSGCVSLWIRMCVYLRLHKFDKFLDGNIAVIFFSSY